MILHGFKEPLRAALEIVRKPRVPLPPVISTRVNRGVFCEAQCCAYIEYPVTHDALHLAFKCSQPHDQLLLPRLTHTSIARRPGDPESGADRARRAHAQRKVQETRRRSRVPHVQHLRMSRSAHNALDRARVLDGSTM